VTAVLLGPWVGVGLAAQETQASSAQSDSAVVVQGTVVDHETGDSIAGATVSLGTGPSGGRGRGTRVTDEGGHFSFQGVPAGTYRLFVTSPGYRQMVDTVQVSADGDVDLILPLSTEAIELEPIIVTARRSPARMRGYEGRRRSGVGFLVTREEIVERRPRLLTELLHRVPGGMVVSTPPHGYTLLLRGQCRPGIWIDGVPVSGANSIDQLLSPHDVEAVEVYHGFELPVEFGVNACGGVLIWTRRGNPEAGSAETGWGLVGSLVRVAAIIAVVLVLTR
jgi:hypothetical protein